MVGQVATIAPASASNEMSRSLTWMPWTIVVRSPEEAGAVEQLDRRAAVLGLALVQLARLLVRVDVADEPVRIGIGGDLAQPVGRHGADAVGGDADRVAGQPQRVHAREVVLDRRVAEARVPAAVIGGGEEDDGQPGGAASATASAIAFGSSYGVPSGRWWT